MIHAQTGAYLSVTGANALGIWRADYNGADVTVSNPTPSLLFNTAAFSVAPPTRFGTSGVGIIPTPGLENFDFSLTKQFSIRDRVTLRVQGDAFNAFNHTNFTSYSTVVTSLSFGSATAAGPGRQLQVGMKVRF